MDWGEQKFTLVKWCIGRSMIRISFSYVSMYRLNASFPFHFIQLLSFLFSLFHSRILRKSSNELYLGFSHFHKILCNNGYCFKSSSLLCAVGLYIKCLDRQCLLVITELVLLRFTVKAILSSFFDTFRELV